MNRKTFIALLKILFTGFISAGQILNAYSQVPEKMKYQAVLRNSVNEVVSNTSVGIRISILKGTVEGPVVFAESQTVTTNSNGLFTLEIGSGTLISGSLADINWPDGPYFIQTETDPAGGTNYSLTGVSQLLTVPYAFYAKSAGNGFSGIYDDLANKPVLFSGGWTDITGKPTSIAGYGITDAVTTSGNQSIAGNKTFTGTTTVSTPVSPTDASTKAYVDLLKAQINDLMEIMNKNGLKTLKDIDSNLYKVVTIGNQTWMGENLKVTHYNNGEVIPNVTENTAWQNTTSGAYCWYNNDIVNKENFGALYNWYAINDSRNICPVGFHVPTDDEWKVLEIYLGILVFDANFAGWRGDDEGGKLKETGDVYWDNNSGATNSSGFSARGAGYRSSVGTMDQQLFLGGWWTKTASASNQAWYREIYSYNPNITRYYDLKTQGRSLRCIKN